MRLFRRILKLQALSGTWNRLMTAGWPLDWGGNIKVWLKWGREFVQITFPFLACRAPHCFYMCYTKNALNITTICTYGSGKLTTSCPFLHDVCLSPLLLAIMALLLTSPSQTCGNSAITKNFETRFTVQNNQHGEYSNREQCHNITPTLIVSEWGHTYDILIWKPLQPSLIILVSDVQQVTIQRCSSFKWVLWDSAFVTFHKNAETG